MQSTLESAALRVWLAPWSCLSRPESTGRTSTGSTREDTGESCTRPVILANSGATLQIHGESDNARNAALAPDIAATANTI